jgi:alcohol dehydrogenase class IV
MKMPVPVEFGAACIERLPNYLHGCRRVFLVSGLRGTAAAAAAQWVCDAVTGAGAECHVYEEISTEPCAEEIERGGQAANEFGAQLVVGCGGGSAMDAAKAIAVSATHLGPILDYRVNGPRAITDAALPNLAVTTTSGTGSHVGRVAVISDRANLRKCPLGSDYLYPRAAFCDPKILCMMPPEITAASGFDAFAQALEGYLSSVEDPLGNLCALEAIRLISAALPRAVAQGGDLSLRAAMAWADTLQGISLATQGVLIPHVIGMVLGGRYKIAHGRAIASVMLACIGHSRPGATEKLARVAAAMGCPIELAGDAAADWAVQSIGRLIERLGIGQTPADYGVPRSDFESIGEEVLRDFQRRVIADPVPTDARGIAAILHRAVDRAATQPSKT